MTKTSLIIVALSFYISVYSLLGFAREPMRMDFLMDKRPVKLMIFSADWCSPCRAARRAMEENASLKGIVDSYEVVKYDFDKAVPMRRKYKVTKVPTFIIVADDQEVRRQVGFSSVDKLKKFLD